MLSTNKLIELRRSSGKGGMIGALEDVFDAAGDHAIHSIDAPGYADAEIQSTDWESNMSWIEGLIQGFWSPLSDFFGEAGNLFSSLVGRLTGNHLTGAEQEANAFNAEQAELDRRFQSSEAEVARAWQEEQYNKYNSPSAMMNQYKEAGINPALMFGQQTTPAPTQTSVPSGASASSVAPGGGHDLISSLIGLTKLASEKRLVDAQASKAEAEADESSSRTALNEQLHAWNPVKWAAEVGVNESTISKIKAETDKAIADTDVTKQLLEWNPSLFANELKNGQANRDVLLARIAEIQANIQNDTARVAGELKKIDSDISVNEFQKVLLAAQAALANSNATSVNFDNFMKEVNQEAFKISGLNPSDRWDNMIIRTLSDVGRTIKTGSDKAKNSLKGLFGKK